MKINKLKLTNFRNHKSFNLEFEGKSMLIRATNGSGKTNILEAIHLLSTTKSLRARYDREMIHYDEEYLRIEAQIEKHNDEIELEMFIQKNPNFQNMSSKTVKIDRTKKGISMFAGTLNTVLFTPESIDLISGSPSNRRKYMDMVLFQIDSEYKTAHTKYLKVVRQRNKILEIINETGSGISQLEYWNKELLTNGNLIQKKREDFLLYVQQNLNSYADKLSEDKLTFSLEYIKKEITEEKLKEYQHREIASKNTLMGPHRDDIDFTMEGHSLSSYGSRGQQRTNVLALKLCELDYINNSVGERPVLLLDDIYSELDELHKKAIDNIIPLQQTLITNADTDKSEIEFIEI